MRHLALLSTLLLLSIHALAGPMNFVEQNFSVEMPPGWSAINPAPPRALLAIQSPGKTEKFIVYATKAQSLVHSNDAREVYKDSKERMSKAGYKIDPDQNTTLGGLPFVFFVAHMSPSGTVTDYTANAGDQVYVLQAISGGNDAAADAQLQAAVQSFKLLAPVDAPAQTATPAGAGSRGFMVFVRVFLAGMIVLAVFMFFRRPKATPRQ
jgi:hypothetical protein